MHVYTSLCMYVSVYKYIYMCIQTLTYYLP